MSLLDLTFNFINRSLEASTKKVGSWIDGINDINSSNMTKIKSNFEILENESENKEPKITENIESTYWNGLKVFVDFATSVRNSTLTGLSTVLNTVITANDTVLSAIGKLQGQLDLKASQTDVDNIVDGTFSVGNAQKLGGTTIEQINEALASKANSNNAVFTGAATLNGQQLATMSPIRSWKPNLSEIPGLTYAEQRGEYSIVGNVLFYSAYVTVDSVGAGSDSLFVMVGFPAANIGMRAWGQSILMNAKALGGAYTVKHYVQEGSPAMHLHASDASTGNFINLSFNQIIKDGTRIEISGYYIIS